MIDREVPMSNLVDSSSSSGGSGSGSGSGGEPPEKRRERKPLDPAKMLTSEDSSDDDWYYLPRGETEVNEEVWEKYLKQISESDGFDIKDFPGACFYATVVPMDLNDKTFEVKSLPELAKFAIKEYNESSPGTKYEFLKVEKANISGCAGLLFYITFLAQEQRPVNPAVKTFQAKVWQKIPYPEREVLLCRLKEEKPSENDDKASGGSF